MHSAYLNKANDIFEKVEDYLFQSYVWSDIGNVYLALKQYDNAIESYNKGLAISAKTSVLRNPDHYY